MTLSTAVTIFFSYDHHESKDRELFNKLMNHLSVLKREGYVSKWYDSVASAGSNWRQMVEYHIHKSQIIVLLISAEFFASEICYDVEMKQALALCEAGLARVLSVLLRPVDKMGLRDLDKAYMLPTDGRPISSWTDKDAAFIDVVGGIRRAINEFIANSFGNKRKHAKNDHLFISLRKNDFFTGREEILARLYTFFQKGPHVNTPIQALTGLPGIGKTQIAIEYAYRYQDKYQMFFWLQGPSPERLSADILNLADDLAIPEKGRVDEQQLFDTFKEYLQQHTQWLLIIDNLDDLSLINLVVPVRAQGHVLLTTRSQVTGTIAHACSVPPMAPDESACFLLRRAKIIEEDQDIQISHEKYQHALAIAQAVDGHPLALDQAGAYIEETHRDLVNYLELYQSCRAALLQQRGRLLSDHPDSVATTFTLVFEQVVRLHPPAMELLHLFAFLHPDAIPDEMIIQGLAKFDSPLKKLAADPIAFDNAIFTLFRFSLISHHTDSTTLSIHRVVQDMIKETLSLEKQREWINLVVRLVNTAFPDGEFDNWSICQRYLPQAQRCADYILSLPLLFDEAFQLLDHLGGYCFERAFYGDAERYLTHALRLRRQMLGQEHADTIQSLNRLARLLLKQGHAQEAEHLQQQSLAFCKKLYGPNHAEVAYCLNGLGQIYRSEGKFDRAEVAYRQALKIYKRTLDVDHVNIATALNNLAVLYHEEGRYDRAESLYRRALQLRERLLSATHPDLAQSLNNMAAFYQKMGHYKQAEPLFRKAVVICEQIVGSEHPDTANRLNNLGACCECLGRYEEAEALYQRALSIYEKVFPDNHPDTAQSLNNLAYLYRIQGKYDQAEALYQRALTIYERMSGAKHYNTANVLNNLGRLYLLQNDVLRAAPFLQRALTIREQVLGADHASTAQSLSNLAELYVAQGRYEEAEPLYQRALAIRTRALGENHPDVAIVLENYATLLAKTQREDKAIELEQAAAKIRAQYK